MTSGRSLRSSRCPPRGPPTYSSWAVTSDTFGAWPGRYSIKIGTLVLCLARGHGPTVDGRRPEASMRPSEHPRARGRRKTSDCARRHHAPTAPILPPAVQPAEPNCGRVPADLREGVDPTFDVDEAFA